MLLPRILTTNTGGAHSENSHLQSFIRKHYMHIKKKVLMIDEASFACKIGKTNSKSTQSRYPLRGCYIASNGDAFSL